MMKKTKTPDANQYPFVLTYDNEDKLYIARAIDLKGCHSAGQTPKEAIENIYEAMTGWLETAQKNKINIPKPSSVEEEKPKKFPLRLDSKNASKLQTLAILKQKSLNTLINEAIAAM